MKKYRIVPSLQSIAQPNVKASKDADIVSVLWEKNLVCAVRLSFFRDANLL